MQAVKGRKQSTVHTVETSINHNKDQQGKIALNV